MSDRRIHATYPDMFEHRHCTSSSTSTLLTSHSKIWLYLEAQFWSAHDLIEILLLGANCLMVDTSWYKLSHMVLLGFMSFNCMRWGKLPIISYVWSSADDLFTDSQTKKPQPSRVLASGQLRIIKFHQIFCETFLNMEWCCTVISTWAWAGLNDGWMVRYVILAQHTLLNPKKHALM